MKPACLMLTLVIIVAIICVCIMVKFATEITVEERKRGLFNGEDVYRLTRSMGIVTLKEEQLYINRYPYVAAVMRNSSNSWVFSCFGAVYESKWLITTAHCRINASYRVIFYSDIARNLTRTFPIQFWRIHDHYEVKNNNFLNDIAIAKLNTEMYNYSERNIILDCQISNDIEASIWKTVFTMDKIVYLTNEMANYRPKISDKRLCSELFGIEIDDSIICVDMSEYVDCFINEFGPIFIGDRLLGVLSVKPKECNNKYAVFTNVSFFTNWLRKSSQTNFYG